jgi:hypothetical protein
MAEEISSTARIAQQPGLFSSLFLEHPRSLGESYAAHLRHALGFGVAMIVAGFACVVHALVPALFTQTASATVLRLRERMAQSRRFDVTARGLRG